MTTLCLILGIAMLVLYVSAVVRGVYTSRSERAEARRKLDAIRRAVGDRK
jgi:uncharacterized protein (DUF2225 family)